jgi:hypothetical protein
MSAKSDRIHAFAQWGIVAAYAAAIEWIAFRAGNPADPWWWLWGIPLSLWIVAPIAVPLLLRIKHWLLTAGVAAMAVYGVYLYEVSMFGPGVRSTSGVIFVFLPLYQWFGTALLLLVALATRRRTSR